MADPNLEDEESGEPGENQDDDAQVDDNEEDPDAAEEGQDDDPAGGAADDADPDVSRETLQVEQPRRSRAQERIRASQAAVKVERERAERLERELAESRAGTSRTQAAAEQERESALMASMDESQKTQYLMAKAIRETQIGTQRLEQRIFDSNDRATFLARTASDKRAHALRDKVEDAYQQLVRSLPPTATPISREIVYYTLLGREIANASPKRAAKQREAGQRRIADARGSGGSVRSDATPRRGGKTAEERLDGVFI